MYFHAYISTETNASTKYSDSLVTDRHGEQVYYINCDDNSHHAYPLFFGNLTNTYVRELSDYVTCIFDKFGFGGMYHDEAATSNTAYTFSAWAPAPIRPGGSKLG